MCRIVIIAGPNGAGKSSFANEFLLIGSNPPPYINADEIARRMAGPHGATEPFNLAAGRQMLLTIDRFVAGQSEFAFETTLATRIYAKQIPIWREIGYSVVLVYLRLPSIERSIERVARRSRSGGHDIPEVAIRRRFDKSWQYFETLYKPVVDHWLLYNSVEGRTEFVEEGYNK